MALPSHDPPAATQGGAAPKPGARAVRSLVTRAGVEVELGPIAAVEAQELFGLFAEVVASGDGYPHAAPLTWEAFEATWVRPVTMVVAARLAGALVGAYYLEPNFPGRASHIANAGYVVAAEHRGTGIGRALVEDSIERAPALGFDAVQFNLVFADNPARALYEKLGWRETGRVPAAVEGRDAVVYWRPVG